MNNYSALLISYGKPHVPLELVAKDYLAPMSDRQLKARAAQHSLPFPAFREDSQKGPWLVDLRDLAAYIDESMAKARERVKSGAFKLEMDKLIASIPPEPSYSGFNRHRPATCYYVRIDIGGESFYKIGITGNSVSERFGVERKYITVLKTWRYSTGAEAISHERKVLRRYNWFLHRGDAVLRTGNSEIFIKDVLGLDTAHASRNH